MDSANGTQQPAAPPAAGAAAQVPAPEAVGLTTAQAEELLRAHGPNVIPEAREPAWKPLARKFWGPIPWMLEATVILELALGKYLEAGIVAVVLLFNGLLGFLQERRAKEAVALLRQRLSIQARVLRDGRWQLLPAAQLVIGDVIHVRMGDILPADVILREGNLRIDQSALTGESVAVDAGPGATAYSGSTVVQGEATCEVTATGGATFFGKTAQLVASSGAEDHLAGVVFRVVRAFIILDFALAAIGAGYLASTGASLSTVAAYIVVLLLASVPVAMPAAFTLAGALGARKLAHQGILTARLTAVQAAAGMDILCVDKTGTITQNRLTVGAVVPREGFSEAEVLRLAAEASDEATQDPIDLAIIAAAAPGALPPRPKTSFQPFDPATKRSEATIEDGGRRISVTKGAPQVIAALAGADAAAAEREAALESLAARGMRVLSVAVSGPGGWQEAGFVGLADPVRPDAAELIARVHALGVRVIMITGDTLATGKAVAASVGISGPAATAEALRSGPEGGDVEAAVFAEVLPEDKLRLVRRLQAAGHVVGMTGDGVNDAPALRQADAGIAVAGATDVAKAAAAVVLTREGLVDMVGLIEESRRIFQRSLTYALNVSIKKIEVPLLLTAGVLLWKESLFTPLLMALLLLANDVMSMSIMTDRVAFSPRPDRWATRPLLAGAVLVALPLLAASGTTVWFARDAWPKLALAELQSLAFFVLVLSSQATIYLVRERRHAWASRPGRWLVTASAADIAAVLALVGGGLLITRVPLPVIAAAAGVTLLGALAADFVKVAAFRALGLHAGPGLASGQGAR
ncbi:plasma-membrane proton-efflux P-type ATPase [Tepidiforma flava]|uniref:Plasma-membrane proton-efflux P-type ATPase n=1 Tax=Tepidiforma flava TaxID=3004094 RepID=A0ABY7M9Q7_9CHLR|nr:plasma-membrane proton-efflux P-type ATPase [Tepidiforma flava]WBL37259.1 plasma-membrane proton-efflux P-type ATPase [Tepidiforma flava]